MTGTSAYRMSVRAAAVREVLDNPTFRGAAGHIAAAIAEETADDRVVAEVESLLRETSAGFAVTTK